VADFLGFGRDIKTEEHMDRKYDENQIYRHFTNCQDFLTFNPDETTTWKRRVNFTKSMQFLKETTERCVEAAQPGLFGSIFGGPSYGSAQDGETVKSLRKFGVNIAQYLVKEKCKTKEEAAAIMLFTAINATYKSILVVSFTAFRITIRVKLTSSSSPAFFLFSLTRPTLSTGGQFKVLQIRLSRVLTRKRPSTTRS
jgi:hypothetical protein